MARYLISYWGADPTTPYSNIESFKNDYLCGNNGNLLFKNAVTKSLASPENELSYFHMFDQKNKDITQAFAHNDINYINNHFDAVILSEADLFNTSYIPRFPYFIDFLEQINIPIVMVGVGKGAQNGVLIKNAEALEKMNKVNALIIDKTGTITEGKPTVVKIGTFNADYDERKVLQYIASVNSNSEHPLAEATVKYSKEQNAEIIKSENFSAVTGKGVEATIEGRKVALGNPKMMEYANAEITSSMQDEAKKHQQQGKTVSFLAVDKKVVGYVVIGDKIKETSKKAIAELQKQGIDVIMLTGDNHDTAQAIATELSLTNFKAGMLPEDKLREVEKLQQQGKVVAMAGDGINDAPALAKSDVGIAMGTGTDVAIESAMITLVKGDLHGIVKAQKLSQSVMRNIKQNLFFAFIYNVLGIPIAAGVLFLSFGILLSPMIAALAMSFSSVSVIVNALRLRTIKI